MKKALFTVNDPNAPRLCPELAQEIGLNESILLLQIEFWIRTSNTEEREGKSWTYQSVRDIQGFFKFWSLDTINRAIKSLEKQRLIVIGNFNKRAGDRTRWFALNFEACGNLKSIRIGDYRTPSPQNRTGAYDNRTPSMQNRTTLPETTTETTPKTTPKESSETKPVSPAPAPEPLGKDSKPKPDLYPVASALSEVCVMSLETNRGRLFKEAKVLCAATAPPVTPDEVRARYGPGGWWYHADWRGQKGEHPTPAIIRATWGQWLIPRSIPAHSGKPTKADLIASIQEQWDKEDGIIRDNPGDSPNILEHIPSPTGRGTDRRAPPPRVG